MLTYFTVYFGTMLISILLVPLVSRLAKRYRLVDKPGPRKVHKIPIPRIGGIVFVISTLTIILPIFFLDNNIGQSFRQSSVEFITLLIGACFIFIVGLIDDLHPLRGYIKLICLLIASVAICASGATLSSISLGSADLNTGPAAWPLTIIWIVIITVCISIIDGLDGLAAGIAAIVCGSIVCIALWSGQQAMAVLMLALLGSVTGFLFFNFYPAKIFMGDCGSMFLGFMIGAGSIVCQTKISTMVGLSIPFLVLGAPIFDMGLVIVARQMLERRSMFAPDKSHLHHRLLQLGLNHRAVVIVIYAITAISASLGLLMLTTDYNWSIGLLTGGIIFLFTTIAILHSGRFHKMLKALKDNWTLAKEAKRESHIFENAQTKMYESNTFRSWWNILCDMGREMHFKNIEVWKHVNNQSINTCAWNAPCEESQTNKIISVSFPIDRNMTESWEIKASIWKNTYLELNGRQVMLLGRLIDEFPPPEEKESHEDSINHIIAEKKENQFQTTKETIEQSGKSTEFPAPIEILGIPVMPLESYEHALDLVEEIITSRAKSLWMAVNPIKMYHAWHNPELLKTLKQADVGICDGIGVSIASKILYGRSIFRCTGCDLFFRLLTLADKKQWNIYMLGASAESNAAARKKIQSIYPNIKITGWHDGYFKESDNIVEKINASKANLLFVAMGSPKQEFWISSHWRDINVNFCMGVGGSFDIAAGALKRAPKIFRITGTEFLYRLVREPLKRWSIQKVLFPYAFQIIEKKTEDFILAEEESKKDEGQQINVSHSSIK